ncbi:MAG: prepilin-type N-terminal cleavage/methylation domain-containing protein [Fimbriimonadaceae bacterium]
MNTKKTTHRFGFTLIELLVVIAIIAILAAILFPVFAQAKVAAKKAQQISNNKQINTATMIYMADYDDYYPRNDDCQPGSSLNPALKNAAFNATGVGCTAPPFYNRMNHYAWQKWVMPYAKSLPIFYHSTRPPIDVATGSCPGGIWSGCGQIYGSVALNLALTGALDTYNRPPTATRQFRNSWLGGNQTSLPDAAAPWLFMDLYSTSLNFASVFTSPDAVTQTAYPVAIRELWVPQFMKGDAASCAYTNDVDTTRVPFSESVVLGFADGHTATMNVKKFLANTPTAAQYNVSSRWNCTFTGGSWTISAAPTWTGSWPMWALQ